MNVLWVTILSLCGFLIAYRFYGKFLSEKIFTLDPNRRTPAHELEDGIDYIPTRKWVLFGHHFVSICGLGPILGPAIAVIWGWLPALLWVVLGNILMGAVHDFSALFVSLRNKGRSVGDIMVDLVGHRARLLFLFIIFFLIAFAMGVFVLVIAILMGEDYHPEAIIPVFSLMLIAGLTGFLVYRTKFGLGPATLLGLLMMFVFIWIGVKNPISIPQTTLIYLLLAYAFVSSVLPVWLLLQPRDYLNSYKLYLGLGLMYLGVFIYHPRFSAPAINHEPSDLPSLFPFLFITIACGAISGFHGLVSSGTTAKQLNNERDARLVGYGGMLGEGIMGLMAVLACTAGITTAALWHKHYASWEAAQGLGPKMDAFVNGAGFFMSKVGIPLEYATAFVAVVVVAFAMTTLDSATRLLRYNIEEIGRSFNLKFITHRYFASFLAVAAIGYFALLKIGGKPAGLALWQLFGTSNQLLAGLGLLTVSLFLFKKGKPTIYTLIPMLFMLVTTITAMVIKIGQFWEQKTIPLLVMGTIVLLMALWLGIEAFISYRSFANQRKKEIQHV
jgi:carbon starvation protein